MHHLDVVALALGYLCMVTITIGAMTVLVVEWERYRDAKDRTRRIVQAVKEPVEPVDYAAELFHRGPEPRRIPSDPWSD